MQAIKLFFIKYMKIENRKDAIKGNSKNKNGTMNCLVW